MSDLDKNLESPSFPEFIDALYTGDVVNIRVLKDQQFSDFMMAVARKYPQIAGELDKVTHIPAMTPGAIVEGARIDEIGRVHFIRAEYGEPWYLPRGWYEVIDG